MEQELIYEKKEGVAILTLNRPRRLNSLPPKMQRELEALTEEARRDDEVRVLVVTGVDPGFCAGAEVDTLSASVEGGSIQPIASRAEHLEPDYWSKSIHDFPKPTIAAVNGVAAGGGLALALACDLRIASERARFISVWVRRALAPDMGSSYYLPRLVGHARAAMIMFTGDEVNAREAERIGLVNQVVPHEELMPAALALAGRLARGPAVAVEWAKRLLLYSLHNQLGAQMDLERHAIRVTTATEDFKEGVRSFLEKREPKFTGR